MMRIIFFGIGVFTLCIILGALFLLLRGDGSRGQKLMQYFLVGSLVQNMGYLLELMAPTLEAAVVAVKMQYLGSLAIPISYCYFIFIYCCEKVPLKTLRFLQLADLLIMGLVFTCDWHSFYYSSISWMQAADGYSYMSLSYGPGYWLFMLCGTVVPYAMTMYVLLRTCARRPEYAADRKCRLILGLSLLPVLALLSYAMKATYVYDLTPSVLGLILSSVVILIWSRKVYDFSSLASGTLLESMSDGVIALDANRKIVNYNPAAAEIFGELGDMAIGRHIEMLAGFPQEILGGDRKEDFSLNGRFYQGHGKEIADKFGKNKGYVVLVLDMTETINYIEEIKRVREQAEQANIAKSAFLANMSHEIRTPMNAIVGLSEVIVEESRGRKVYEYACDIKSSSRNLLALINDILDLSKVEAGRMELMPAVYHVKTLVSEVLSMMDVVASKRGIMLKSDCDMSLPCQYLGDEGRIRQILINVLNNALKFTREGSVELSVGGVPEGGDMERLIFRIADTGCGIKEEDLESIFENFKQVDSRRNRSVEGSGLGLAITRRLVDLMQGEIRVESVYGEGSTFIIEIPQKIVDHRPLSEVPEAAVRKAEDLRVFFADNYKVLVVDDNAVNRRVARIFLQSYGLAITEAESGAEAIRLVRQTRFDMILMDHMMPEMDGIEAVHLIREECGENGRLPVVIALTANAMEGVRETFFENGFQDFITKPLDRKILHDALQKWIPQERRVAGKEGVLGWRPEDGRPQGLKNISIKGIDTGEVEKRGSGSQEEYRELLELYCLDGKRKLMFLRELQEQGDYKTYGIEAHALKSASANVGAMELSRKAREHEEAVGRGDTAFVDSNVHSLLEEYETQLGHIRDFLGLRKRQGDAGEKKAMLPKEELLQNIREALDSLERFRAKDCARKIEELLQHELGARTEARLKEIQGQLKLYEDDAAEQMLRELTGEIEEED